MNMKYEKGDKLSAGTSHREAATWLDHVDLFSNNSHRTHTKTNRFSVHYTCHRTLSNKILYPLFDELLEFLLTNDILRQKLPVPFAMGDFHNKFLKGHSIAVGCPKLDDAEFYIEKLAAMLKANKLNSLTVIHMEVPCCFGLTVIAKKAVEQAKGDLSFKDVTVSLDGSISKSETIYI